jgi:hypothetical protein
MSSFKSTNSVARKLENFVVKSLINSGFKDANIPHPNEYFPDYDVYADEKHTIECKDDEKAHHDSTNVCIEYGQYNDDGERFDSGIVKTKSTHWLHSNGIEHDDTTFFFAKTSVVRKLFNVTVKYFDDYNKIYDKYDGVECELKLSELIESLKNETDMVFFVVECLYPIRRFSFKKKCPVPQGDGQPDKDMDLLLIPQYIFKKYCLEVVNKHEITYKDLV